MSYGLRSKGAVADINMENNVAANNELVYTASADATNQVENAIGNGREPEPTLRDIMIMLKANRKRLQDIDDKLSKVDVIEADLAIVKAEQDVTNEHLQDTDDRVVALENENASMKASFNDALMKLQISATVNEYNSKQHNVLISNMPKKGRNEKPTESRRIVKEVLQNVLKINDVDTIKFVNAHRLPGKDKNRPTLIFKLCSMFDKQRIWDNIEKLTTYNLNRPDEEKIYIDMNHLPKKLREDKKSLFINFKTAKNSGKSPKWKFDKSTGEYGYTIDKVWYKPTNNFVHV